MTDTERDLLIALAEKVSSSSNLDKHGDVGRALANFRHLQREPEQKSKWRNSSQIRGVRARLVAAINVSEDGAYARVDLRTARNLVEICNQAIHTEEGHGV